MQNSLKVNNAFLYAICLCTLLFFGATATANNCANNTCDPSEASEARSLGVKKRITHDQQAEALFTNSILAAIDSGDVELVSYIARRGWLSCPRRDEFDCDYVQYAARARVPLAMLEYLLSQGFEITLSAVEAAAKNGNLGAIRLFCDRGADINPIVTYEEHAGSETVGRATATLSEHLEQRLSKSSGQTPRNPLGDARILSDSAKIIEYMEGGGCKGPASGIPDNYVAMVAALQRGDSKSVKRLFTREHLATQHIRVQIYLLYEAVSSGDSRVLRHLKNLGLLRRCRESANCFPVHVAAQQRDDAGIIRFLMSEGFSTDAYNYPQGATPLHYAATAGNISVVRTLCEHGAKYFNLMFPNTVDERSTIDSLRDAYEDLWCTLNEDKNDRAMTACTMTASSEVPECTPGSACYGVAFPPAGDRRLVNRIIGLAKTFEFINAGSCALRRSKRTSSIDEEQQQ